MSVECRGITRENVVCYRDGDTGVDDEQTNDDETSDDYCMSPTSPLGRHHRSFLSSSDDSLASTVTDVSTFIKSSICCYSLNRKVASNNVLSLEATRRDVIFGSQNTGDLLSMVTFTLAMRHQLIPLVP